MFTSVSGTRSEKDFFDYCWTIANPFGSPLFFGDQAVSFFSKSGLEKGTLGQIWRMVDDKNHGYLDRQQFDKALRLIGYTQRGFDISDPNRTWIGVLPTFEGVEFPPTSGSAPNPQPPPLSSPFATQPSPLPTTSPSLGVLPHWMTSATPSFGSSSVTSAFATNYEAQLEEQQKMLAKIQAHQEEQSKVHEAYLEKLLKQQQEQTRLFQERLEPLYNTAFAKMSQQPMGSGTDLNGSLPFDLKAIFDNSQRQSNIIIEGYLAALAEVGNSGGVDAPKVPQSLSTSGDRIPAETRSSSTGGNDSVSKENTVGVAAYSGARMSVPPDSESLSSPLGRCPPRAPEYVSPPSSLGTQPQQSSFFATQQQRRQEPQYVPPPPRYSQNYPLPLPTHSFQQQPYQAGGLNVQVEGSGSLSNTGYVPPPASQGARDHPPTALPDWSLPPRSHIPAQPTGNAQGPRAPQYRGPPTTSTAGRLYRAPECRD